MKKSTKVWLITASSLILLGIILFGGTMSMISWDFAKLSTVKYETATHEITQSFNNISIKANTDKITILPSPDGICKVVCFEQEKLRHNVTVDEETLTIKKTDTRKWYENITIFSFSTPKIIIYLPKTEYTSLLISLSTGDVELSDNFKFNNIDISVSTGDINISSIECTEVLRTKCTTGDIKLTNVTCASLISTGDTGDIALTNVMAKESFNIERTTGDISLDSCDAREIFIETNTGNVCGTLLSEKTFVVNTSTGNIDVPKTTSGGNCSITTSTGDIKISIK